MVSPKQLTHFLKRHRRIGLDSNLLIYFIEAHPEYHRTAKHLFRSIEAGKTTGVCSTLSLLEVLVQPYRNNNDELVNQFYGLLTTYPNLLWVELTTEIADLGARFRSKYAIRTPDAILLATAAFAGATGFVCNDIQLKRISELDILTLSTTGQ